MPSLKDAIRAVGGPSSAAKICGISARAIHKWLSAGRLPRTEFSGESNYSAKLAAASHGQFTAEALKQSCMPNAANSTEMKSSESAPKVPVQASSIPVTVVT